jgi:hypothetical protein
MQTVHALQPAGLPTPSRYLHGGTEVRCSCCGLQIHPKEQLLNAALLNQPGKVKRCLRAWVDVNCKGEVGWGEMSVS